MWAWELNVEGMDRQTSQTGRSLGVPPNSLIFLIVHLVNLCYCKTHVNVYLYTFHKYKYI